MNPRANRHLGTVQARQSGKWQIALADPAGCAVCHRGLCWNSREARVVEVKACDAVLTRGQKVSVEVSDRSGWHAIILFYAIPSLLLISFLLITLASGLHEGVAGAGALLILIPYYFVLALTRKHWRDKIQLTVRSV